MRSPALEYSRSTPYLSPMRPSRFGEMSHNAQILYRSLRSSRIGRCMICATFPKPITPTFNFSMIPCLPLERHLIDSSKPYAESLASVSEKERASSGTPDRVAARHPGTHRWRVVCPGGKLEPCTRSEP